MRVSSFESLVVRDARQQWLDCVDGDPFGPEGSWLEYVADVAYYEQAERSTSEYVGSLVGADRWDHSRLTARLALVWIETALSLPDVPCELRGEMAREGRAWTVTA